MKKKILNLNGVQYGYPGGTQILKHLDLFLFEGASQVKNISLQDSIKGKYYNQVLNKHSVTMAQYDSTLVWYMKNTKYYVPMHEQVLLELKQLESEIKEGKYIRQSGHQNWQYYSGGGFGGGGGGTWGGPPGGAK